MEKGKILMIVTSCDKMPNGHATGLWLEEFAVPYNEFVEHGYAVEVASIKGGTAPIDPRSQATPEQASAWSKAAAALNTTRPVAQVSTQDYVAVFLPGGHGTMFDLPNSIPLQKVLSEFAKQDKIIAAVCHGPAGLMGVRNAQGELLIAGKRMAAFTDSEERAVGLDKSVPFLLESSLREAGANMVTQADWTDHVEIDGNLITGQNPQSSGSAARALVQKLVGGTS